MPLASQRRQGAVAGEGGEVEDVEGTTWRKGSSEGEYKFLTLGLSSPWRECGGEEERAKSGVEDGVGIDGEGWLSVLEDERTLSTGSGDNFSPLAVWFWEVSSVGGVTDRSTRTVTWMWGQTMWIWNGGMIG